MRLCNIEMADCETRTPDPVETVRRRFRPITALIKCYDNSGEHGMRRRGFIAVLGGAAAWPIVARAQQQQGAIRRIAVLMGTAEEADGKARLSAFQRGLHDLNWVEGRSVSFAVRWGGGN